MIRRRPLIPTPIHRPATLDFRRARGYRGPPMANETSKRPTWDEYFLRIAEEVAKRSTCLRRHVGAILVLDKYILATGYNGPPSGVPHCDEAGCLREQLNVPSGERHELCRGLHGEMNAILQAARHGTRIDGATLYSTHHPCSLCAKMLINGGIRRVVVREDYPDELGKQMLRQAAIPIDVVGPEAD